MNYVEKEIGENKYACQVIGEGKEETLVLLHGFTGSRETWVPFIHKWSSAFQIILIDLPGHGKSITPDFPDMVAFCDELKELLLGFNVKKCHLLGYSLGGRVALSFAQRHPEFVSSLILESASPGLKTEKERLERRNNDQILAKRLMEHGIEQFIEEWESIPLFSSQKRLPAKTKEKIRNERMMQNASGLSQSLLQMGTGSQPSWWNRLATLGMPVLLVVGGLDEKFVQINQAMEKAINSSELIIVQEAGHAVHVEQAEKFATIVMEFLYLKNV